METTIALNEKTRSEVYWANVTDMLSQAINGEIVGMANFAMLTGTIDDVHEMFECVEHSNCERHHAEGFIEMAKKYNLPVIINREGYYWNAVREVFKKWANAKDYIGCIIIQEVILECFAVSLYKDVGSALHDHEIGQLFLAISKEEEEHIEHSIDLLKAELEKDRDGFLEKVAAVHYDCMTIMAEMTASKDHKGHCGICGGSCMKDNLYATNVELKMLKGNALNLYMRTLDRIGVPGVMSLEWVANLPS